LEKKIFLKQGKEWEVAEHSKRHTITITRNFSKTHISSFSHMILKSIYHSVARTETNNTLVGEVLEVL
jgi:hypothetical protein